jgi:hypothetical protein
MQRQSLLNFQSFGFIVQVGTEGQLLLWSNSGLDEWMFALREAVNRSKGRREALRKSQTLLPSMTGGGIWNRYKLHLQSIPFIVNESVQQKVFTKAGYSL